MTKEETVAAATKAVTETLIARGKLIEAGFAALIAAAYHGTDDMPKEQYDGLREAFFAGAQHLFGSIMSTLSEGDEIRPEDIKRLDQINTELAEFLAEFKKQYGV